MPDVPTPELPAPEVRAPDVPAPDVPAPDAPAPPAAAGAAAGTLADGLRMSDGFGVNGGRTEAFTGTHTPYCGFTLTEERRSSAASRS